MCKFISDKSYLNLLQDGPFGSAQEEGAKKA